MAVQTQPSLRTEVRKVSREQLAREIQQRLWHWENLYELPSTRLVEAVESRQLRETKDVCDWLIEWELYQDLTR